MTRHLRYHSFPWSGPSSAFGRIAVLGATLLAACGSYRPARFTDQPVVMSVSDNRAISMPAIREFSEVVYLNDTYLRRPIVGALDLERVPDALDVNATDEVPRSTWFSPVPIEEIRASYDAEGAPWPPFVVEAGAPLSQRGGIRVRDARGYRYELHRDPKKLRASTTTVKAIASRLVRALGYRTPSVWIVGLKRKDLIVASKDARLAKNVDKFIKSGPDSDPDGSFRVSATRWPRGIDVGHCDPYGTRSDDPNDRFPHEDRRTLRALRLVAAWLAMDRLTPENTKDVYEGNPDEGHLVHYVVGLEHSLGVTRLRGLKMRRSPAGEVRGGVFHNFITLGFAPAPGPRKSQTLGELGSKVDPSRFTDTYEPAARMRPDDGYWIAKRMADLPVDVIEWAVKEGHLGDADVERKLTDAILARRRGVVGSAFRLVTPLEPVRLGLMRAELVLRDEAIRHGVAANDTTQYRVRFLDSSGSPIADVEQLHPYGSEVIVPLLSAFLAARDYFVVEVTLIRNGVRAPRTFEAHLLAAADAWRVAGLMH